MCRWMYYDIYNTFKDDLQKDEEIRWAGQPTTKIYLTGIDVFLTLFAIGWLAMTIPGFNSAYILFQETGVIFPMIFMIPFLAVGLYLLFFRFIQLKNRKKKTYYIITNKRIISIIKKKNNKIFQAEFIKNIPSINKKIRKNGVGTIIFGNTPYFMASMYGNTAMNYGQMNNQYGYYGSIYPVFLDIHDAEQVYNIVNDIWKKTQ